MEFKDKLKELRKKANVSQSELAEKIFMSRSVVAKWENGMGLPSDESLERLCAFFGVEKGELLGSAEAESVLIEKNRRISRQKTILICCIVLAGALVLTVLLMSFLSSGRASVQGVVQDGVIYELSGSGRSYTAVGAEKNEKRGAQYYKRSLVIADFIEDMPVTKIGQYAFYDMTFEDVRLGANLQTIDYGAFWKCSVTGEFDFGPCKNLTRIGENAFMQCTGLGELRLPGPIEIERSAFSGASLTEVTIGGAVKVCAYAFAETKIRNLTFEGAAELEEDAFAGCHWLEQLRFLNADVKFPEAACAFPHESFLTWNVEYAGTYEEWCEKAVLENFRSLDADGYSLHTSDFDGFINYYK